MPVNLEKYYQYLKSAGADTPPTFESFSKTLSDEASAKTYYNYLRTNKFDAPDTFDSFARTLGVKKKDGGIQGPLSVPSLSRLAQDKAQRHQQIKGMTFDQVTQEYDAKADDVLRLTTGKTGLPDFASQYTKMAELQQSREGKVANIAKKYANTGVASKSDFKYLAEAAPIVAKQLMAPEGAKTIDPKTPITETEIDAFVNDSKSKSLTRTADFYRKNFEAGIQKAQSLMPNLDPNRFGDDAYITAITNNLRNIRKQSIDALEKKFPIKTRTTLDAPEFGGAVTEQFRDNEAQYKVEKQELDQRLLDIDEAIKGVSAAAASLDARIPGVDPKDVGMKFMKFANPELYANRSKTTYSAQDRDIMQVGVQLKYANATDINQLANIREEENVLDDRSPEKAVADTYRRLAAELYKGDNWLYNRDPSDEELEKAAQQLPDYNRNIYEKHIKGKRGFLSQIPQSGAINQLSRQFENTNFQTVNFLKRLGGQRVESDVARDALDRPFQTRYEAVGANPADVKRLKDLKKLPNPTTEELNEIEDLETFTNVRSKASEIIDGSFGLAGQVLYQALMTRGVGGGLFSGARSLGIAAAPTARAAAGAGAFENAASSIASTAMSGGLTLPQLYNVAGAAVAYASSYDAADQDAMSLFPDDPTKRKIYASTVGSLNALSERIFKDEKIFDAFKRQVAPSVARLVEDISTKKLSETLVANRLKDIIKGGMDFVKLTTIENVKETTEEVATSVGTSVAKLVLAPAKFEMTEAIQDAVDTATMMFSDGWLVAAFAGAGAHRANKVGIPIMSQLGTNAPLTESVRSLISAQAMSGQLTPQQAAEKMRVVNTIAATNQNDMKMLADQTGLAGRAKQKYAIALAHEKLLMQDMNNTQDAALKAQMQSRIKESEALRRQILNKEVFIDKEYRALTPEQAAREKKAQEDATQISQRQKQERVPEGGVVQPERIEEGQPEIRQGEGVLGQAPVTPTDAGDRAVEGPGGVAPGRRLFNEPNPAAAQIEAEFKAARNIETPEPAPIRKLNVERSKSIADAYAAMEDKPDDPEVKAAYEAMANETMDQFDAITKSGVKFEIWEGEGEPYASSEEMIRDVRDNKHMYILSTEKDFGQQAITDEQRQKNPLLRDSGVKDVNGKPLLINDVFRGVHDFFGHTRLGNSFGAVGEENAWNVHARMYSPIARRAMTTETRGQNSWVNFGPQMRNEDGSIKKPGDPGYLGPRERAFAEQKLGLLPEEFSNIEEEYSARQEPQVAEREAATQEEKQPEAPKAEKVEEQVPQDEESQVRAASDGIADILRDTLGAVDSWQNILARAAEALRKFNLTISVVSNSEFIARGGMENDAFFESKTGEILFNRDKLADPRMAGRIIWHETSHPIVNVIRNKNPELYRAMARGIQEMANRNTQFGEAVRDWAVNQYWNQYDKNGNLIIETEAEKIDRVTDEMIVEAISYLAAFPESVNEMPKSVRQAIMEFVNMLAKMLGMNPVFTKADITRQDVAAARAAIEEIADILKTGRDAAGFVGEENVGAIQAEGMQARAGDVAMDPNPAFFENIKEFANKSSFKNKLEFKKAIQEILTDHISTLKKTYGKKFDPSKYDDATRKYLSDVLVKEALNAIMLHPEAIGWYDEKTSSALDAIATVYPEIATDPKFRGAFIAALAIMSNGNKVDTNFELAEAQYRHFKENGRFNEKGEFGSQQDGIRKTLKTVNAMLDQGMTMNQLNDFFTSKFRAGDLKYRKKDGKLGYLLSGELAEEEVFGAAVLGPKIGNGFYMNLWGEFGQLTMDRWFMRTWGRLTGTLVKKDPSLIAKGKERMKAAIKSSQKNRAAAEIFNSVIGDVKGLTEEQVARKINKASINKQLRDKLSANEITNELRLAGNSLVKNIEGEKEAPSGGKERSFIRQVFGDVQRRLKTDHDIDITMADLQAVIWYPEKILYESFKAGESYDDASEDYTEDSAPDYFNSAKKLAIKLGSTNERINQAISDRRSADERAGGRGDTGVGEGRGELDQKVLKALRVYKGGAPDLETKRRGKVQASAGGRNLIRDAKLDKFMTPDGKGNYVFFHYSGNRFKKLNPNKFGSNLVTGRSEQPGIGLSLFYTEPGTVESGVPADYGYAVKVPMDKVYPFNSDPLDLYDEAEAEFRKVYGPIVAFDANKQVGFMTKVAAKYGYPVTVADWSIKGRRMMRAQTTMPLPVEEFRKKTSSGIYTNPAYQGLKSNRQASAGGRKVVGDIKWERSPEGKGDPSISSRNPIVTKAAQDLKAGLITNEEYRATVSENSPIIPITRFFEPATEKEIRNAFSVSTKKDTEAENIGKPIYENKKVGLRLDIPSYQYNNTWVVSVHEGHTRSGKIISYGNVAKIKNVLFEAIPIPALNIATGEVSKTSVARMYGEWENIEGNTLEEKGESAKKMIQDIVDDPSYVQVGMNPFRHSYFYDRNTDIGRPIVSADEVIQVGGLVYAKNPVYGKWTDESYKVKNKLDAAGSPVQFSVGNRMPIETKAKLSQYIKDQKKKGFSESALQKALMERMGMDENAARLFVMDPDRFGGSITNEAFLNRPGGGGYFSPRAIPVAPIPGGEPKQLRDIIFDLAEGLRQKISFDKPKRALGSYNPSQKLVRIRYNNDLDVTAHEIGHSIDDEFGVMPRIEMDAAAVAELNQFAIFGSQPPANHPDPAAYIRGEGFAEFMRAYLVNPADTVVAAPNIARIFEAAVPDATLKNLKAFSDDIRRWAGLSGMDKIMSNVKMDPDTMPSAIRQMFNKKKSGDFTITWLDRLGTNFTDEFKVFEKAIDHLVGVQGIDNLVPKNDPEILLRLLGGFDAKFGDMMENGLIDENLERVMDDGNLMNVSWLLDPIADYNAEGKLVALDSKTLKDRMNAIVALMVAERTIELGFRFERADILSGIGGGIFTDFETAEAALNDLKRRADYDKLQEAVRRYRAMSDQVLQYMVAKGRLAYDEYDSEGNLVGGYLYIKQNNLQYVAMNRIQETEPGQVIESKFGSPKSLGSKDEILMAIQGSTKTIQNPYISMFDNVYRGYREADRNEVLLNFRNLLVNPRMMGEAGMRRTSDVGYTVSGPGKDVVTVFVNGKPEYWRLQTDLANAVKGIAEATVSLPRVFTLLPRMLRWTVTNFPIFALRNVVRDTQHRIIISNEGNVWQQVKALAYSKEDSDMAARTGALNAGHYFKSKEMYYSLLKDAEQAISKTGAVITAPEYLPKLWSKYQDFLYKGENANRIAEFKNAYDKAIKQGMDPVSAQLLAASKARSLIDFAVAGRYMKWINQLIPFSNAAVQGLRSAYNRVVESPGSFILRTAAFSVLPQVVLWALNHKDDDDEKEYEDLLDYQRDMFHNFKVGETWISIPKPFELGVVAAATDRALSYLNGYKDAYKGFSGTIAKSLFMFEESDLAGPAQKLIEMEANRDFFRDKTIIPPHEFEMDVEERKGASTASNLGKFISSAMKPIKDADPRMVDFFIRGQFSYFGNMAIKMSNLGEIDARTKFGVSDTGFAKEFSAYNSKSVQEVMKYAKRKNITTSKPYKAFMSKIENYFTITDPAERGEYGRQLIDESKTVLKDMEQYLLDKKTKEQREEALGLNEGPIESFRQFAKDNKLTNTKIYRSFNDEVEKYMEVSDSLAQEQAKRELSELSKTLTESLKQWMAENR